MEAGFPPMHNGQNVYANAHRAKCLRPCCWGWGSGKRGVSVICQYSHFTLILILINFIWGLNQLKHNVPDLLWQKQVRKLKADKLTSWQTHRLTNYKAVRLTKLQDDKLTIIQLDRMTWWLTRWHGDMTIVANSCKQLPKVDKIWQELPKVF